MDNPNPDYSSPKIPSPPLLTATCPSRQPVPLGKIMYGRSTAAPQLARTNHSPRTVLLDLSTFNCRPSTFLTLPPPPRTSPHPPSTPQSPPPCESLRAPQPPC